MADKPNLGTGTQGAGEEHLDDGQGVNGAPKPPAVSNKPPEKVEDTPLDKPEGMDEELGDTEDKSDKSSKEKVADKVEDDKQPEKKETAPLTEYVTLEDPSGQAAINLLKEAGVDPNEANSIFAKAIQSGDMADIDRAKLEKLVGKDKAVLILAGAQDYYTRAQEHRDADIKAVYDVGGGEQNWNPLREWAQASEKADSASKRRIDQVRDMLSKGGLYAEAGARELVRMHKADPSTKGLSASTNNLVSGDSIPDAGKPMSRSDYVEALHKAHRDGASAATIGALDARRLAGKKAGI